jgi:hypothetical protein
MAKFRALLIVLITYLLSGPQVYAQALTGEEKMQWFFDRLPFSVGYGVLTGTFVALLWLRRVKYVPENLSLDRQVRQRFVVALVFSLIVFAGAVWLDLWLFYSFENFVQGPVEALSETTSLQTFVLASIASLMFYVASLVWTRGAFSGRYALWPGPKRH